MQSSPHTPTVLTETTPQPEEYFAFFAQPQQHQQQHQQHPDEVSPDEVSFTLASQSPHHQPRPNPVGFNNSFDLGQFRVIENSRPNSTSYGQNNTTTHTNASSNSHGGFNPSLESAAYHTSDESYRHGVIPNAGQPYYTTNYIFTSAAEQGYTIITTPMQGANHITNTIPPLPNNASVSYKYNTAAAMGGGIGHGNGQDHQVQVQEDMGHAPRAMVPLPGGRSSSGIVPFHPHQQAYQGNSRSVTSRQSSNGSVMTTQTTPYPPLTAFDRAQYNSNYEIYQSNPYHAMVSQNNQSKQGDGSNPAMMHLQNRLNNNTNNNTRVGHTAASRLHQVQSTPTSHNNSPNSFKRFITGAVPASPQGTRSMAPVSTTTTTTTTNNLTIPQSNGQTTTRLGMSSSSHHNRTSGNSRNLNLNDHNSQYLQYVAAPGPNRSVSTVGSNPGFANDHNGVPYHNGVYAVEVPRFDDAGSSLNLGDGIDDKHMGSNYYINRQNEARSQGTWSVVLEEPIITTGTTMSRHSYNYGYINPANDTRSVNASIIAAIPHANNAPQNRLITPVTALKSESSNQSDFGDKIDLTTFDALAPLPQQHRGIFFSSTVASTPSNDNVNPHNQSSASRPTLRNSLNNLNAPPTTNNAGPNYLTNHYGGMGPHQSAYLGLNTDNTTHNNQSVGLVSSNTNTSPSNKGQSLAFHNNPAMFPVNNHVDHANGTNGPTDGAAPQHDAAPVPRHDQRTDVPITPVPLFNQTNPPMHPVVSFAPLVNHYHTSHLLPNRVSDDPFYHTNNHHIVPLSHALMPHNTIGDQISLASIQTSGSSINNSVTRSSPHFIQDAYDPTMVEEPRLPMVPPLATRNHGY